MTNRYAHLDKPFKKKYENSCLGNLFLSKDILQKLFTWIKRKEHFFLFLGCPGCGKTQCATALYNWLCENGKEVRYVEWAKLLADLRHAYTTHMTDQHILQRYLDANYLIIDDIKHEGFNEWARDRLYDVIDSRCTSELPTFISSNIREEDMENIFGDRISSRLLCSDNIRVSDWENDYRQK